MPVYQEVFGPARRWGCKSVLALALKSLCEGVVISGK
jgi:hypothetical protein